MSSDSESKLSLEVVSKFIFIQAYLIMVSDFDLHSWVNDENVAAISAAMVHENLFTCFAPPNHNPVLSRPRTYKPVSVNKLF